MTFLYVAFDPDMLHFPLPFRIQAKWQGSVGYAQDFPTILISFDTLTFSRLCGAPSRCASRGMVPPLSSISLVRVRANISLPPTGVGMPAICTATATNCTEKPLL